MRYTMQEFLREANRRQRIKDRREKRWLFTFIAALVCCNLLILGPCNLGRFHDPAMFDIKPGIESRMKYGQSANWDGRVSCSAWYRHQNSFNQCFR